MKKIIFLILILLFIVGCNINMSNISEIEIINPKNGEKEIISKDSNTAKLIIAALNKKEKTGDDISELYAFELLIKRNAESEAFFMSFDLKNKSVYLSKDREVYKVKDIIAHDLLMDDSFSYVYVYNSMNKLEIYINDAIVVPHTQYEWIIKKIDGTSESKSGTLFDTNEKVNIKNDYNVEVKYDVIPDSQLTKVYCNGDIIYTCNSITDAINSIQYDGEYFIESQVNWNKKNGLENYGNMVLSFMAQIDKPAGFNIISKENYPGNIMIVQVNNLNDYETVKIKTKAVNAETEIYAYKDKFISIMPIDLYAKAGEYDVNAVFNEGKNTEYTIAKKMSIKNKEFKTQYLTVSEELNNSNNDDKSIQEFIEVVKPARTETSPKKLWEGEFLKPVDGRLTTDFAEIRYVNNEMSSSRHSGVDIAAPKGTEIKSPNHGKVTLVANGLLSTGNTLVIDHGMGLFTSYYHLDSILVKEGDLVNKGQIIGAVGTTGFSTGPHLHYAVSIYNTYVNTYQPLNGIFD